MFILQLSPLFVVKAHKSLSYLRHNPVYSNILDLFEFIKKNFYIISFSDNTAVLWCQDFEVNIINNIQGVF